MSAPTPCRCGWTSGPHPCHHCGGLDDCQERLYAQPIGTYSLAGVQPKVSARRSFLCAACHAHNVEEFRRAAVTP